MENFLKFILFIILICLTYYVTSTSIDNNMINEHTTDDFVFWPKAIIPFYIDTEHYDPQQSMSIMTSLWTFSLKTCLKFAPVQQRPKDSDHALVFENPKGIRKCTLNTDGHSVDESHIVTLGYDCLRSPDIDMMIMNALGFPFEHNRASRDIYIDVQHENIEPGFIELFTKEYKLPLMMRSLPYDIHSALHFDERSFTKNGHRTIIFKDHNTKQNRIGLSDLDLRKIELVYGPECQKRDRQEKIELCQNYSVIRKKRETDLNKTDEDSNYVTQSLRVNPDITPPGESDDLMKSLKDMGVENEVQAIVDQVNKVSALALRNARGKYCNNSKSDLRTDDEGTKKTDILGIVESIAEYTKVMIDHSIENLTEFCEASKSLTIYQRSRCPFYDTNRCVKTNYRSTKSGPVRYSTKYRPFIRQSTNHKGSNAAKVQYDSQYMRVRDDNSTANETLRRKREVEVEFYGNKRQSNYLNEMVSRLKRDVASTDAIVEVAEQITEASKVEEETANSELPVSVNDASITKGDLRMANTMPPKSKKIAYAPVDGQYFGNRRYRVKRDDRDDSQLSVEHNAPNSKYENGRPFKNRERKRISKDENERENNNRMKHDGSGVSREEDKYKIEPQVKSNYNNKKNTRYEKVSSAEDTEDIGPKDSDESIKVKQKYKKGTQDENGREAEEEKRYVEEGQREKKTLKKRKKKESVEQSSEDGNPPPRTDSYVPRSVPLSKSNKEFYGDRRWPHGIVRYLIKEDGSYDINDVRLRLSEVNDILRAKTCVKIQEISEGEASEYEDYLVLDSSPDYVTGRVGGKQSFGVVELLRGGQHRQHAAMMVMAMLGFYFEVARHDRDKYIRVHTRHVRPDKLHHFEKIRSDATLELPYDYQSATHPAWQFWRQIGKAGISTVATYKEQDPDGSLMKSLGQNEQLLSDLDLVKINSVYGVKCFNGR